MATQDGNASNVDRVVQSQYSPLSLRRSSMFVMTAIFLSVFADVPMPPIHKLTMAEAFGDNGKPKHEVLKNNFIQEGRVEEDVALKIIRDATAILRKERNVLEVEAPITGRFEVL